MKTMIWKEFREHGRWVPLGLLAVVMAVMMAWHGQRVVFGPGELALCVGMVSCPFAALLGVLQCWGDRRPAARALLLHRGLTLDAIFFGKLLAGAILHATAVTMPLFITAIYLAVTGIEHRAAHPAVVTPALLVGAASFAFWLAAVLVMHRDAWFLGSRLLPPVAAFVAVGACASSLFSGEVQWLLLALVIGLFCAFGQSARAVFQSSAGQADGSARLSLAVVLTLAILTCVVALAATIEAQRRAAATARPGGYYWYQVDLGPDGEPWLTMPRPAYPAVDDTDQHIAKLAPNGSVRSKLQPQPEDWSAIKQFTGNRHYVTYYGRPRALGERFREFHAFYAPARTSERRIFVHDMHEDAMLVYQTSRLRGWTLLARLRPPTSADSFHTIYDASQFSEQGGCTLVTVTGVYQIPNKSTEVEAIHRFPTGAKPSGFQVFSSGQQGRTFGVMLWFDDRVVLLERDLDEQDRQHAASLGSFQDIGEVFQTDVVLPRSLADRKAITIARDPRNEESYVGLGHEGGAGRQEFAWFRFDRAGRIDAHVSYEEDISFSVNYDERIILGCLPPGVYGVAAIVAAAAYPESLEQTWQTTGELKTMWSLVVMVALQGLAGGCLAWLGAHRRRVSVGARRWWVLYGLLFGPAAGLSVSAVYARLGFTACSTCRSLTRLDRASCEHCRELLDDSTSKGIEIFDLANDPAERESVGVV